MNDLTVKPEQLTVVTSDIDEARTTMVDAVGALSGGMSDLDASWQGEAHSAFLRRYGQWCDAMNQDFDILSAIGAAVEAAGQRYREADAAVCKLWSL